MSVLTQLYCFFYPGCLGFHFGGFDLVCHPFFTGYNHGPGIFGHEQRPRSSLANGRGCGEWFGGSPGGSKIARYHRWICHTFPHFDGCHVNWLCWGHCCRLYHNIWHLPGTKNHFSLREISSASMSWKANSKALEYFIVYLDAWVLAVIKICPFKLLLQAWIQTCFDDLLTQKYQNVYFQ